MHRAAQRHGINSTVADDYLKVTGGIESGNRQYTDTGDVLTGPATKLGSNWRARGMGQVMPDQPGGMTRTINKRTFNLADPDENAEAGLLLFNAGGQDPVARRLEYFGGQKARKQYERTGQIPQGGDGYTSYQQYVAQTMGPAKRQKPKDDILSGGLVDTQPQQPATGALAEMEAVSRQAAGTTPTTATPPKQTSVAPSVEQPEAPQTTGLTTNDAAWHFGMTPDQAQRLTRRQARVLEAAVAEDNRKKAAGEQITPPSLDYQNQMRAKAGLAPLKFNLPAEREMQFGSITLKVPTNRATSPYYQPGGQPEETKLWRPPQIEIRPPDIRGRMAQFGDQQRRQRQEAQERGINVDQVRREVTARLQLAKGPEVYSSKSPEGIEQFRTRMPTVSVMDIDNATDREIQARIAEVDRQRRVSQMGWGQYLKQAPKSVVTGFTGMAETSLKSIAVLAKKIDDLTGGERIEGFRDRDGKLVTEGRKKETTDYATYQLGEAIQDTARSVLGSDADLEQEFGVGQAPASIGNVASFMLGGWATKSPKLAAVILGALSTGGDAYDEVRRAGGSDEEAVNAGLLAGGLLGPTELFGMRGAMHALEDQIAQRTWRAALKEALREGRRDIVENVLQEMGQEMGQGLITGQIRSPGQILQAGILGGIGSTVTVPTTLIANRPRAEARQMEAAPDVVNRDQEGPIQLPEGGQRPILSEELPSTINAQMNAMLEHRGNRVGVLIPKGQSAPTKIPKGYVATRTNEGVMIHPKELSATDVRELVNGGETWRMLGHANPDGPAATRVVIARSGRDAAGGVTAGSELMASYVEPGQEQNAIDEMRAQFEPYSPYFEVGGQETDQQAAADRTAPIVGRRTTAPERRVGGVALPPGQQERRNRTARRLRGERAGRRSAERLAETDELTGVANQKAYLKAVPAIEADPNTTIISSDLGNLKAANKFLGRAGGDQAIKDQAAAVKQAALEHGVTRDVFRDSGDEILAAVPNELAEPIRKRAIELFVPRKAGQYDVTLDVGIGQTRAEADNDLNARKTGVRFRPLEGDTKTGTYVPTEEPRRAPGVTPAPGQQPVVPKPSDDVVRLYRADRPDAPEASGQGWANDINYVSQKHGAGQMGGQESIWYIDVPKKQLDESMGDWRSVGITSTSVLEQNGIEVKPQLYRRITEPTEAAPSRFEGLSNQQIEDYIANTRASAEKRIARLSAPVAKGTSRATREARPIRLQRTQERTARRIAEAQAELETRRAGRGEIPSFEKYLEEEAGGTAGGVRVETLSDAERASLRKQYDAKYYPEQKPHHSQFQRRRQRGPRRGQFAPGRIETSPIGDTETTTPEKRMPWEQPAEGEAPEAAEGQLFATAKKYAAREPTKDEEAALREPTIQVKPLEKQNALRSYLGNKITMARAGAFDIIPESWRDKWTEIVDVFGGSGIHGWQLGKALAKPVNYNELDPDVYAFQQLARTSEGQEELRRVWNPMLDEIARIRQQHPEGGPEAHRLISTWWNDTTKRLRRADATPAEKAARVLLENSLGTMGGTQSLIGIDHKWKKDIGSLGDVSALLDKHRLNAQMWKETTNERAEDLIPKTKPGQLVVLDPPYASTKGYAVGNEHGSVNGAVNFVDNSIAPAVDRGVSILYTNSAHLPIVEALRRAGLETRIERVQTQTRAGQQGAFRYEVTAWTPDVSPPRPTDPNVLRGLIEQDTTAGQRDLTGQTGEELWNTLIRAAQAGEIGPATSVMDIVRRPPGEQARRNLEVEHGRLVNEVARILSREQHFSVKGDPIPVESVLQREIDRHNNLRDELLRRVEDGTERGEIAKEFPYATIADVSAEARQLTPQEKAAPAVTEPEVAYQPMEGDRVAWTDDDGKERTGKILKVLPSGAYRVRVDGRTAERKMRLPADTEFRPHAREVKAPKKPVGRPKLNTATDSLERAIRSLGGIEDDGTGEVDILRESGKSGLVTKDGRSAEDMAMALAELGYGRGVWWEGSMAQGASEFSGVNKDQFIQAAIDDASGSTRHYSAEFEQDLSAEEERYWRKQMEDADEAQFDAAREVIDSPMGEQLLGEIADGQATNETYSQLGQFADEVGLEPAVTNQIIDLAEAETPQPDTARRGPLFGGPETSAEGGRRSLIPEDDEVDHEIENYQLPEELKLEGPPQPSPIDNPELRKPPEQVFPPPKETVRAAKQVSETLPLPAAQARVDQWREFAKRIGQEENHAHEVVIVLFDRTGIMSQPWRDAGYTVFNFDIAHGDDILENFPMQLIDDIYRGGGEIIGIGAMPPCTSFTVSGARWWESQHDAPNPEMVEKKYGYSAAKYFDTPLEYAKALVHATQAVVELANPTKWHWLENPVGRIADVTGVPKQPTYTFDPHHFGEPFTKRTLIWGSFNTNLPLANVEPTKGSFIAKLRGDVASEKLQRSESPEGFAYSFFMANHTSDLQFEGTESAGPFVDEEGTLHDESGTPLFRRRELDLGPREPQIKAELDKIDKQLETAAPKGAKAKRLTARKKELLAELGDLAQKAQPKPEPEPTFASGTFFSQLYRTIDAKMPNRASVEQIEKIIQSPQNGVKQDEVTWTGLDDFLKRQRGPVTKADLLSFLRANAIELHEQLKAPGANIDYRDENIGLPDLTQGQMDQGWDHQAIEPLQDDQDTQEFEFTHREVPIEIVGSNDAGWHVRWTPEWTGQTGETDLAIAYVDSVTQAKLEAYTAYRDALETEREKYGDMEAKYDRYVLPGPALNYEEQVYTAPLEPRSVRDQRWKRRQTLKREGDAATARMREIEAEYGITGELERSTADAITRLGLNTDKARDDAEDYRESFERVREINAELRTIPTIDPKFESNHWSEENVIAHTRTTHRTDSEGKQGILVEEIQSDLHQQAHDAVKELRENLAAKYNVEPSEVESKANEIEKRALGMRGYTDQQFAEDLNARSFEIHDEQMRLMARNRADTEDISDEEHNINAERLKALDREFHDVEAMRTAAKQGPPAAPFSRTWHELVLRRLIRRAASQGDERIYWTTGRQQIERWQEALRQNVKEIKWYRTGDKVVVQGIPHDESKISAPLHVPIRGRASIQGRNVSLDDVVGKKLAQEIRNAPADGETHVVAGDNLTIGGEGMTQFYDQMIPSFMRRFGAKFGAKVGTTEMPNSRAQNPDFVKSIRRDGNQIVQVQFNGEERRPPDLRYASEAEAIQAFDELKSRMDKVADSERQTVHYMEITDAMRESVMEGQPLFRRLEDLKQSGHIPVVRRQETRGEPISRGTSLFFSPYEVDQFGKGTNLGYHEFGPGLSVRVIDNSANIFEGTSSYEYLKGKGLTSAEDAMVRQITKGRYGTLDDVVDNEGGDEPAEVDQYRVSQAMAERELRKEGYDGAHWKYEDDLTPEQYQVWNRDVLKRAGEVLPNTRPNFSRGGTKGGDTLTRQGNRITLTDSALAALHEAEIFPATTDGMTMRPALAEVYAARMNLAAKTSSNPSALRTVARLVQAATRLSQATSIIIGTPEAMQHETFHEASSAGAQRLQWSSVPKVHEASLRARHARFNELIRHPAFATARAKMLAMGYPKDAPTLVEEAGALIAEGQYRALGLTKKQALDFMELWFTSFAERNGNVSLAQFREMADEAQNAVEKVINQTTETRESDRADKGIRSVSEGRESRAGPTTGRSLIRTDAERLTAEKIKRTGDVPLNPKVARLVEAFNRAGIPTTLSGDFYGNRMVYVDLPGGDLVGGQFVAGTHAYEDALENAELPHGWKVIRADHTATSAFGEQRAEKPYDGPRATKTRLVKLGDSVSNKEIRDLTLAVVDALEAAPLQRAAVDDIANEPEFLGGRFYSQLYRTLASKMANKETVTNLRKMVANPQNNVKADEFIWSGLDEYLDGKENVTRAEVLGFLRDNNLGLKETTLLDRVDSAALKPDIDLLAQHSYRFEENPDEPGVVAFWDEYEDLVSSGEIPAGELREAAERIERAYFARLDYEAGQVSRFSQYTVPGYATNYREILFTLPEPEYAAEAKMAGFVAVPMAEPTEGVRTRWQVLDRHGEGHGSGIGETADEALADWANTAKKDAHGQPLGLGTFQSSHWPETVNVMAHVRVDDRQTVDGKRVLFVNEVQSDWHQRGRREGYGATSDERRQVEAELREAEERHAAMGRPESEAEKERNLEAFNDVIRLRARLKGNVPPAPFSKTWERLVMRRMLAEAVEGGYDYLAWATGDQAAEMFDLARHIDELRVRQRADKTGYFLFGLRGGQEVMRRDVPRGELADWVGQELAKRIIAEAPEPHGSFMGDEITFDTPDLKLGSTGMRGFYDKMLGDYMRKMARKFNSTAEDVNIGPAPPKSNEDIARAAALGHGDGIGADALLRALDDGASYETSMKEARETVARVTKTHEDMVAAFQERADWKQLESLIVKQVADARQPAGKISPAVARQALSRMSNEAHQNNDQEYADAISRVLGAVEGEAPHRSPMSPEMALDQEERYGDPALATRIRGALGEAVAEAKTKRLVHAVEITPEMRESILGERQPLFRRREKETDEEYAKRTRSPLERLRDLALKRGQNFRETPAAPVSTTSAPTTAAPGPTTAAAPPLRAVPPTARRSAEGEIRERSFPRTAESVGYRGGTDRDYSVLTNPEALAQAERKIMKLGLGEAAAELARTEDPGAPENALAILLMQRFERTGQIGRAVAVATDLSRKLTRAGQFVQATSIITRLSPEGVLLSAQRMLKPGRTLSDEAARTIINQARAVSEAERLVAEIQRQRPDVFGANGEILPRPAATAPATAAPTTGTTRTGRTGTQKGARAKIGKLTDRMATLEAAARARIEARKPQGTAPEVLSAFGLGNRRIAADLADLVVIGAAKLARSGMTQAVWLAEMAKEATALTKRDLRRLYRESYEMYERERRQFLRESRERGAVREAARTGRPAPTTKPEYDRIINERLDAQTRARRARTELARSFRDLNAGRTVKAARAVRDVWGLTRALITSVDISAGGRQGKAGLVTHPKAWLRGFGRQFKAFKSSQFERMVSQMQLDPDYKYAQRFKLELTSIGRAESSSIAAHEEVFQTELAEKIPWLRMSQQAYDTMLDTLRFGWFKANLEKARLAGLDPDNPDLTKQFTKDASLINKFTGRGGGERIKQISQYSNAFAFSTRFWASRVEMLMMPLNPRMYGVGENAYSATARADAWKTLFGFYGLIAFQMFLAKLAGAEFNLDPDDDDFVFNPDSADFLKARFGNVHVDFSAGMQGHLRVAARLAKLFYLREIKHEKTKKGPSDIIGQYLRSKEEPNVALIHDLFFSDKVDTDEGPRGTDYAHKPVYLTGKPGTGFVGRVTTSALAKRVLPIVLQDALDGYQQGIGWKQGGLAWLGSTLGEGVTTYSKGYTERSEKFPMKADMDRLGITINPPQRVKPDKYLKFDRETEEEYDARRRAEAQAIIQDLQRLEGMSYYQRLSPRDQEAEIRATIKEARERTRETQPAYQRKEAAQAATP